jgi:hypothetical protein
MARGFDEAVEDGAIVGVDSKQISRDGRQEEVWLVVEVRRKPMTIDCGAAQGMQARKGKERPTGSARHRPQCYSIQRHSDTDSQVVCYTLCIVYD